MGVWYSFTITIKEHSKWNANRKRILKNVIALTNPVPEKESAASAFPTISGCGSSRDAVSRTTRKPPLTARLSISPGWWRREASSVDKTELENLFSAMMDEPETFPEGAREIFNILTQVTLEYRDQMLASRSTLVTVNDVQTSLSWLVPSLATGNIPKMENPVCMELLERWMHALKSLPNKHDTF